MGEVKLGEEGESEKAVEFSRLSEFHHDGRVEVIAWSPESSLLTFPKVGLMTGLSQRIIIFLVERECQSL